MNVLETVEELIRQSPDKVKTKQEALKFALLTSGNGLGWNDSGEIVDYTGTQHWSEAQEFVMVEELPQKLQVAVRPIVEKRVQANNRVLDLLDVQLEKNIKSLTGDVLVERGSLAYSMPDNVSKDWKNAFDSLTEEANVIWDD